ncbi:hypothetical protein Tco_0945762 [Tanacetum coccineum]
MAHHDIEDSVQTLNIGGTAFRNAIGANYLSHSSQYSDLPLIDAVKEWFPTIGYINNWALKKNQPEGPPFTDHMMAICIADESVKFKAPKTSSKDEKKIEATNGGSSLKDPTRSPTSHSKKKKSSSTKDSNPSQPSTFVAAGMHKEDFIKSLE